MDIGHIIQHLLGDSITASTIYGLLLLFVVDFATGVSRAIADHTFAWGALDVWVRAKVAGRLVPVIIVLIGGAVAPDLTILGFSVNPLTAAGIAAGITIAAAEVTSILGNLNPATPNPVPSDNLTIPEHP